MDLYFCLTLPIPIFYMENYIIKRGMFMLQEQCLKYMSGILENIWERLLKHQEHTIWLGI
ncbi:hypothetical protein SDC9_109279 [bioreactor metagenome]|uniref:Uncharacterized protein n=1 Tax=bioreactor metagenome TaxID=1076179 RepID=A0A645BBH0_9ZZZZ